MAAVLGDGLVFDFRMSNEMGSTTVRADFYEEMTQAYFNSRFKCLPRVFWHFGYAQQRQSLHTSRFFGTQFQVFLWYHAGDCNASSTQTRGETKELLRLGESLSTNWNTFNNRNRVGRWMYEKVLKLSKARARSSESEPMQSKGTTSINPQASHGAQWSSVPIENTREWAGGQVFLNLLNVGNESVTLKTQKYLKTALIPISGELGTLMAGAGKHMLSHEHDRWGAVWASGGLAKEWTVDISNGHVQDIVIGL